MKNATWLTCTIDHEKTLGLHQTKTFNILNPVALFQRWVLIYVITDLQQLCLCAYNTLSFLVTHKLSAVVVHQLRLSIGDA